MALPILETATYELTLPSSDVQVKYRPFLVKEEKLLLMAMESEDGKEITKALKEIVQACTFGAINVNALPTFDLEYIFFFINNSNGLTSFLPKRSSISKSVILEIWLLPLAKS